MRTGQHRGWFLFLAAITKPFLYAFTRGEWRGLEHIPARGGVIVVANHVTVVDPLTLAHAMYDGARRLPRYLAKAELFKAPGVGFVMRKGDQIPVYRRSREAANSLRDAEAALAAGELVIVYPEGTCTRDPNGWPMVGKTGVARLALACDVPVIPLAHWGAHQVLAYRSKRPHLIGRKRVQVIAGEPFDMTKYRGLEPTNDVLRDLTDALMTRVKELLGEIRGETPPEGFYVPGSRAVSKPSDDETRPADGSPTAVADSDEAETGVA